MADSEKRVPSTYQPDMNLFSQILHQARLTWRLLLDRRVNPFLKLLPVGAVVYFFAPDILPGPFDDLAMGWLALRLFVELCPPDVVQEHLDEMYRVIPGKWKVSDPPGDVVEGEVKPAEPEG